jgi:hypothetical protein
MVYLLGMGLTGSWEPPMHANCICQKIAPIEQKGQIRAGVECTWDSMLEVHIALLAGIGLHALRKNSFHPRFLKVL